MSGLAADDGGQRGGAARWVRAAQQVHGADAAGDRQRGIDPEGHRELGAADADRGTHDVTAEHRPGL